MQLPQSLKALSSDGASLEPEAACALVDGYDYSEDAVDDIHDPVFI